MPNTEKHNLRKMHFLLVSRKAPTLSNAMRPYLKPWKNCKTWKNAFFAVLREGQNLGKISKPGKMHFWLVSGRAPTLSNAIRPYPKPWTNGKTWKTAFFAGQKLRKIAKRGKMHFLLVCGKAKTLEKLQTWKNAFFAGLWPQRYPTLSVLIANHGKIAKPGKMYVLLACRRAKTLEKLQHMETCIFCWFAGGPHPIQRYPSLSQTWEKLQNVEKCIFCWFPGGPQGYPTLSVLIPNHGKNAKPGKMHFLWFQKHKKMMKSQKQLFGEMPKNDFSWVWLKITTFCRETVTGPNGHPNLWR